MPNRCTVCFHRHLQQMDNAILRGELLTTIAKQYHVSVDALGRHRKHMRSAMSIALAKQPNRSSDESYGNELLDKLERIVVDVEQVQQQAEAAQDMRLVLTACKQRSDLLELRGRLTGAIETGSKSFTINMQAPEPLEQTLADARMLLEVNGYQITRMAAPQIIDGVAYQHPAWCCCEHCNHQENGNGKVLPPAHQ